MARKLVFHKSIPDDLVAAWEHYDGISTELGNRFRAAVRARFREISQRPESFAVDVPPIRFAKIGRFPYLVFFVAKQRHVQLLAVVHGSMNPETWRGRQ